MFRFHLVTQSVLNILMAIWVVVIVSKDLKCLGFLLCLEDIKLNFQVLLSIVTKYKLINSWKFIYLFIFYYEDYKLHRSYPGQSLPDLRGDESEESTDSLIDESEDYLRKSIDSILTGAEPKRRYTRSHSQPEYSLGMLFREK